MKAVSNTPSAASFTAIAEVPEPVAGPHDAIVQVEAFGLNRGELALLAARPAGWIPGQDVAGRVVQAAADGSGPAVGTRVAGLAEMGGWAQRVALPAARLAEVPGTVESEVAASLPLVGLTALRVVRLVGALLGRRVLITAANGAVGVMAVQLARLAGADVTAVAAAAHHNHLRSLGAATVAAVEQADGLFDAIFESVGGEVFGAALQKVRPGGVIVTFGTSSGEKASFSIYDFIGHEGARIESFLSYASGTDVQAGKDLALLLGLVQDGRLQPQVARAHSWSALNETLSDLKARRFAGKAVFRLE